MVSMNVIIVFPYLSHRLAVIIMSISKTINRVWQRTEGLSTYNIHFDGGLNFSSFFGVLTEAISPNAQAHFGHP